MWLHQFFSLYWNKVRTTRLMAIGSTIKGAKKGPNKKEFHAKDKLSFSRPKNFVHCSTIAVCHTTRRAISRRSSLRRAGPRNEQSRYVIVWQKWRASFLKSGNVHPLALVALNRALLVAQQDAFAECVARHCRTRAQRRPTWCKGNALNTSPDVSGLAMKNHGHLIILSSTWLHGKSPA